MLPFALWDFSASSLNASNASPQKLSSHSRNSIRPSRRSEGVRRIYSLRREGLAELRDWLDSFWGDALEAFKLEAERSHRAKKGK